MRHLIAELRALIEEPTPPTQPPKGHGPRGCGPGEEWYPRLGKCVPVSSDSVFPRHNMKPSK